MKHGRIAPLFSRRLTTLLATVLSFLLAPRPASLAALPETPTHQTAPSSEVSSQVPGRRDPDLSGFEKRLARLNAQIGTIRSRIEAESKQEATILSHLARINLNKHLIQTELEAQNVQWEKTAAEIAAIRAQITVIRADLDRNRDAVDRTLAVLYRFGRLNFLHFLLQARDIETYATESKRLTLLARRQDDVVSDFLRTLEGLRSAESALESKRRELAEIIRASGLKRQELESEARKNALLVDEIRKDRRTHEQAVKELEESAGQLEVMMKRIAGGEWALPSAFVPFDELKGRLPWPLPGRVITRFGLQRHPQFRTIVMNNGLEIAPRREATRVLAVHAGKVVYADYFPGYGNLLIIDHGLSYFSLYGHCSEFLVAVGDMAASGQPIALVGDSGSLNGECLYFEIRHKAKALDPLTWLKPGRE
jgi:septal ring factor EnvC (AmiA/AmiB activator)